MPRLLFVVAAVLAAFALGRATAPSDAVAAKVVVKTEKTVETVRVACPPQVEVANEPEPDEPDDPDAIDAEQTDVVRVLAEESRRLAELQAAQGILRGAVSDRTSRELLAGATVVASNGTDREQVVITDENGTYQLTLAPGTYLVTMYFVDSTIQYQQVNVYARQVTDLHGYFELPSQGSMGITFSGSTALENEYYE